MRCCRTRLLSVSRWYGHVVVLPQRQRREPGDRLLNKLASTSMRRRLAALLLLLAATAGAGREDAGPGESKLLADLDIDKDGRVSAAELLKRVQRIRALDSDASEKGMRCEAHRALSRSEITRALLKCFIFCFFKTPRHLFSCAQRGGPRRPR